MRNFHGLLIVLIWIGWILYWYGTARNGKATRRLESHWSRTSHSLPLAAALILLAIPESEGGWMFARFMPRTLAGYWVGVAILSIGLSFSIWARRHLGRNWSGTVTVKVDHELIRTGPYRWVRHPIYTGIILGFLGTALSLGEWRGLLAVVLVTIAFSIKLRLEEQWMTETFGDAYRRYRVEVKSLIPFVL